MSHSSIRPSTTCLRANLLAAALLLCTTSGIVAAQSAPRGPMVRSTSQLVEAGTTADVAGMGFEAGQKITLSANGRKLNAEPFVVDAKGAFSGSIPVPANAAPGPFPVKAQVEGGTAVDFEMKISRRLPLSGQDRFVVASEKLVRGLYQSAYSAKADAVYVTSAVGRPPVKQSELLKVDPKTLKVVARTTPAAAPAPEPTPGQEPREGGLYAVYGVAVDDANGTVWVTNTRQGTVAVYRQDDLALVKQFPRDAVPHARDVAIDSVRGKAYSSATGEDFIAVFDTRTLEPLPKITIASGKSGKTFTPTSLALDAKGGKLYTAGLTTGEVAVIDLAAGAVEKVIALDNARNTVGVAWDAADKRLLAVSQVSDNLHVIDVQTGKVVHDVYVGAGALNVAWDPVGKLAYISNRGANTVAVVDPASGKLVANLDGGSFPNHVTADGKGNVFAVNKSSGEDDANGDRITRIALKK